MVTITTNCLNRHSVSWQSRKYAFKREHFCYNGLVAQTQLAVLDHNGKVS